MLVIEKVNAMPRDGAVGAFTFGKSVGVVLGVATVLGYSIQHVTPQAWKKVMLHGTGKEKGASLKKARELCPEIYDQLKRQKDHNRAEAILIGMYATRRMM